MFNVRNIISRADELTFQELLGQELIKLIQTLEPKYSKSSEMKHLIFQIYSERAFLDNMKLRGILLDLMKQNEIKIIADTLGFLNSKYQDEYEYLKKRKFTSGSEEELIFYNFFNIPLPKLSSTKHTYEDEDNCCFVKGNYQLFSHQRRAINQLKVKLNRFPYRVLLHMPTGSGKTRTSMNLICDYLRETEPSLIIWLASTEELCLQAFEEFERAWEHLGNRTIQIAKLWGNSSINQLLSIKDGVIVAGFPKLTKLINNMSGLKEFSRLASRISFIVVDEAHQSIADRYQRVIEILFNSSQNTRLLGLSATPGRTWNNIEEDQKLADFYNRQKVTLSVLGYENPVEYLINEQYIANVNYRVLEYDNGEDFSNLINKYRKENKKEYSKEILTLLGQDVNRNIRIMDEVIKLSGRHKRIIVFAPSVDSSEAIAIILRVKGYDVYSITSNTDKEARADIIREFKKQDDEVKIICNYGVLTTGFDSPNTSAAVIARPTLSLVLYSQMVGRAIRGPKAGGNKEAEILSVIDTELPGFGSVAESFNNWEDVWNEYR